MLHFVLENAGKAVESLAQSHRNGILQLGTAHLDDVSEFLALGTERSDEFVQVWDEAQVLVVQTYVDSGWVRIVGRLRAVYVVVW